MTDGTDWYRMGLTHAKQMTPMTKASGRSEQRRDAAVPVHIRFGGFFNNDDDGYDRYGGVEHHSTKAVHSESACGNGDI